MHDLRIFIRYLLYIVTPLIAAFVTYQYLSKLLFQPLDPNNKKEVTIEITPKMTFRQICSMLEEKELLRSGRSLSLYARLRGGKKPITVGEYKLTASMTPKQMLEKLLRGDTYKRQIYIPPGTSIWKIGPIIEEAGLMDEKEFSPMLTNAELLARAGISAASFEGYLAPGEYLLGRPIAPEQVVWKMLEQGEKNWPVRFTEAAEKLRMTRHEVLTLASILENTTNNQDERLMISGVFHNRLKKGMKLQSDQTVIYGIRDFKGTITDEDRESPSPYNTYIHYGLPPGPISNSSVQAIEAALFPQETENLFFSPDGNGSFIFSKTQAEHTQKISELMGMEDTGEEETK